MFGFESTYMNVAAVLLIFGGALWTLNILAHIWACAWRWIDDQSSHSFPKLLPSKFYSGRSYDGFDFLAEHGFLGALWVCGIAALWPIAVFGIAPMFGLRFLVRISKHVASMKSAAHTHDANGRMREHDTSDLPPLSIK